MTEKQLHRKREKRRLKRVKNPKTYGRRTIPGAWCGDYLPGKYDLGADPGADGLTGREVFTSR